MKPRKAGRAVAGPKPHSVIDPLPSDRQTRRIRSSTVVNTTDLMIFMRDWPWSCLLRGSRAARDAVLIAMRSGGLRRNEC
jgi:hypothetical protein